MTSLLLTPAIHFPIANLRPALSQLTFATPDHLLFVLDTSTSELVQGRVDTLHTVVARLLRGAARRPSTVPTPDRTRGTSVRAGGGAVDRASGGAREPRRAVRTIDASRRRAARGPRWQATSVSEPPASREQSTSRERSELEVSNERSELSPVSSKRSELSSERGEPLIGNVNM
ncbi:hypothetical protein PENSPDRAFT_737940 [Peniophora sp. CONT]|nr:hypothetical protein PENSPDRAFT_737940 [Peniophora sp. CONT]